MRHLTLIIVCGLLAAVGCGGHTSDDSISADQVESPSPHPAAPDDAMHQSLATMPDDDAHARAMADVRPDHDTGIVTDIRLSDEIRTAWRGIRIRVVDASSGDALQVDAPLGQETDLGDTGLALTASSFIPDFVMDDAGITSRTGKPDNPAARVVITEDGGDPFEGWLFATMPDIHPYPHERYRVFLEGGIPAE